MRTSSTIFYLVITQTQTVIWCSDDQLKVRVFNLDKEQLEAGFADIKFYGVCENQFFAFVAQQWDEDNLSLIGAAINWFEKNHLPGVLKFSIEEPARSHAIAGS